MYKEKTVMRVHSYSFAYIL